ncbi:MAG: hypothetical protein JWP30_1831 [Homoserinimonas sp.]|jgi:hypothetical protein|nr:hypothetical protein [Homoserinimonas sp.]
MPTRSPRIVAAFAVATLLLTGCSNPSGSPEEQAFLDAARGLYEEAGFEWSQPISDAALAYGRGVCDDWEKASQNTREQNIATAQAQAQRSTPNENQAVLLTRVVLVASEYLCPGN